VFLRLLLGEHRSPPQPRGHRGECSIGYRAWEV